MKSKWTIESKRPMSRLGSMEIGLITFFRRCESPVMTSLMTFVTHLGDAKSWVLLSLSLAVVEGGLLSPGIGIGLGALTGAIAAKLMKYGIRRQRPSLYEKGPRTLVEIPDPYSFPSGHTTSAFCVLGLLAVVGAPFIAGWLVFAISIGFSRIYLGVHFPTDVLVGAVLGLFCGGLIAVPLAPFFA